MKNLRSLWKKIKINTPKKGKKEKIRDICYSAHIDRCIYQYYSFLLNSLYNERVALDGFSAAAVAYRTDLHENNIHFSKRAFDFIKTNAPVYVMIGDFTGFFDNLDHTYLKKQWCFSISAVLWILAGWKNTVIRYPRL